MLQRILVTNYNYSVSHEEFEKMANSLAQPSAEVAGCLWKIWLIDRPTNTAGAIYLFKDDQALQNFKNSEFVANVLAHPALSNFDFRERDMLGEPNAITHAPVPQLATA